MENSILVFDNQQYTDLYSIKQQLILYIEEVICPKPADQVVIKLNLVGPFHPDKAATSHPEVVRIVIESFLPFGCEIQLCEDIDDKDTDGYLAKCKIQPILDEYNLKFYNLREYGYEHIWVDGQEYMYSSLVLSADFVVQIPKFKTHMLTGFTGAIKNMYGCIEKHQKKELHKEIDEKKFADIISTIYSIRKPDLIIMDAVIAMQGLGPSTGEPKYLGKIIAGTDSVFVDYYITKYVGFEDKDTQVIQSAVEKGFIGLPLDEIEIRGSSFEKILDFQKTSIIKGRRKFKQFNKLFFGILKKSFYIDKELCKSCGLCEKNCPFDAISMEEGFPVIEQDKCMLCACCIELCPHNAIAANKQA